MGKRKKKKENSGNVDGMLNPSHTSRFATIYSDGGVRFHGFREGFPSMPCDMGARSVLDKCKLQGDHIPNNISESIKGLLLKKVRFPCLCVYKAGLDCFRNTVKITKRSVHREIHSLYSDSTA